MVTWALASPPANVGKTYQTEIAILKRVRVQICGTSKTALLVHQNYQYEQGPCVVDVSGNKVERIECTAGS